MAQTVSANRIATGGGLTVGKNLSVTCEQIKTLDITIPASSTDLAIPFPVDYSQLSVLAIYAAADMTIETNSGSSPDDTIVMNIDETKIWVAGETGAPITQDVTATLYVTSTAGGALKILAGYTDATP